MRSWSWTCALQGRNSLQEQLTEAQIISSARCFFPGPDLQAICFDTSVQARSEHPDGSPSSRHCTFSGSTRRQLEACLTSFACDCDPVYVGPSRLLLEPQGCNVVRLLLCTESNSLPLLSRCSIQVCRLVLLALRGLERALTCYITLQRLCKYGMHHAQWAAAAANRRPLAASLSQRSTR